MKMKYFLAALALSLVMSATARASMKETGVPPRATEAVGHEVAAPSWSAACMTDQGPSQCGEPMWVYGGSSAFKRTRSPF